ncbi:MAG: hypothetical protein HFF34_11730 [Oscillospiraceae bacterium]|jgi:hypothetical protein|nr:hypothetical protein [Oscillospiraceae bacterium]
MYNTQCLQFTIETLFRGGIGEHGYTDSEIRELLDELDYGSLLQGVRHNAQTVHAYAMQGRQCKAFNYRGGDLFGQRATLLYEDYEQSWSGIVTTDRSYELWLLEDMSLVTVACVSLDCGDGEYVTEYREIKEGGPWHTEIHLDLDELAERLDGLCGGSAECNIPVYEL